MSAEARRAAVLAQAMGIIAEHGYHGFSIADLAKRCGISDAGLLHHFRSKDDLLVALLRDRDRQDELAVAEAVHGDGVEVSSSPATTRAILHRIVERNAAQPELVRLYAILRAEALTPDHPAADFFQRREAATSTLFAQMLAPFARDPTAAARHLSAAMHGLEMQWVQEEHRFDLLVEWDALASKLLEDCDYG